MAKEKSPRTSRREKKNILKRFGRYISNGQVSFLRAGHLDMLEGTRKGIAFYDSESGDKIIDGFSSAGC